MKTKKAQLKIQQMAFMLIAVTIFMLMVALVFFAIQLRDMKQKANTAEYNKAVLMAEFVAESPEFSCNDRDYCVDTDKLIVFNASSYKGFWNIAYIKVKRIFPKEQDVVCRIENYPNCNVYNVFENSQRKWEGTMGTGSHVALCRTEIIGGYASRKCELGVVIIGYEVVPLK